MERLKSEQAAMNTHIYIISSTHETGTVGSGNVIMRVFVISLTKRTRILIIFYISYI